MSSGSAKQARGYVPELVTLHLPAEERDPISSEDMAIAFAGGAAAAEPGAKPIDTGPTSKTRADYREKIWDHAAGKLIVEAAGGRVSDIYGLPLDFSHGRALQENRGIVATSGASRRPGRVVTPNSRTVRHSNGRGLSCRLAAERNPPDCPRQNPVYRQYRRELLPVTLATMRWCIRYCVR